MNQLSFSDEAYTYKKKTTRKERFLGEMDEVLPWDDLLQPILRKYPKPGQGRRPIPAATMLRIYFMQQWYGLSDPGMEDSLYDVASMRRFAGVALDAIPDETTICKFRHFLERHRLTEVLFERTGQYLSERGLIVREGTIVDATILAAPTSTKNRDQARDPQMGSTKKGTTWHFGLKAHVGSDPQGRVHTVVVTSASVHDSQMMDDCLHGDEAVIYGDKAYVDAQRQQDAQAEGPGQSHYKWPCDKSLARYLWSHPALSRLVWMPALVVLSCWSRLSAMWRITAIFSGPCPRRMRD